MRSRAVRRRKLEFDSQMVFSPEKAKRDFDLDLSDLASYRAKKGQAGSRHTYYDIRTPGRDDWLSSLSRDGASWEDTRAEIFSQASWVGRRR